MKMKRMITSIVLGILLSVPAFAKSYRVAIFDYDIRNKDEMSVAKHVEKQLKATDLSFSEILQVDGGENDKKSLQVLNELEKSKFDLIITITSDAMIPAHHSLLTTPWLFTNVNNPKFFGIKDLNKPGGNKSGVTYYVPVIKQLKLFNEVMNGEMKKIGLLFDKSAKSRKAELREFRNAAQDLNIDVEIELIKKKEDLTVAAKSLISKNVDAIILTSSNKVYKNVGLILNDTTEKNIPIFTVNKKGVAKGAVSAFASDYYSMVDECLIPMAIEVLQNGKKAGTMAVRSQEKPSVYLNLTQAKEIGLNVSDKTKKRASKTF